MMDQDEKETFYAFYRGDRDSLPDTVRGCRNLECTFVYDHAKYDKCSVCTDFPGAQLWREETKKLVKGLFAAIAHLSMDDATVLIKVPPQTFRDIRDGRFIPPFEELFIMMFRAGFTFEIRAVDTGKAREMFLNLDKRLLTVEIAERDDDE